MGRIKIINKYECGCEEVKLELEIPGETEDIVKLKLTLCMNCLTAQWQKDKKEGFSLRDMFHKVLNEEESEKGQSPEERE